MAGRGVATRLNEHIPWMFCRSGIFWLAKSPEICQLENVSAHGYYSLKVLSVAVVGPPAM